MEQLGTTARLPVSLAGSRAIITAGAGGIGKAVADTFAAAGAQVFICDIDLEAVATSGHRGRATDMGDPEAVDVFMAAAIEELGGLDILVNNAGIAGPTAPVEQVSTADVEKTLQINLTSMFQCVRHAIPALRESGGGTIVNLSSVAGKFGFARRSPYSASKWGVLGLTRSLAIELGPDKIRVNSVLPGVVEGARLQQVLSAQAAAQGLAYGELVEGLMKNVDLASFVTQQDVANMILYLASPFGATITGQAISVDSGVERM